MNIHYRLGFRAIKSAIAVAICLIISYFVKQVGATFACIAAIICMQQTYNKSIKKGIQRTIGTVVGGLIGCAVLCFYHFYPGINAELLSIVIIPLCLLVVIYFCNVIKYRESVQIGCIVLVSVVLMYETQAENVHMTSILLYVFNRVWHTCVGIVVATLVNRFFFPNKDKSCDKN